MDAGCSHRDSTPPQRYGEVDVSKVFSLVPIPTQRLTVVLACEHKGCHLTIGLGNIFSILLAIPDGSYALSISRITCNTIVDNIMS